MKRFLTMIANAFLWQQVCWKCSEPMMCTGFTPHYRQWECQTPACREDTGA